MFEFWQKKFNQHNTVQNALKSLDKQICSSNIYLKWQKKMLLITEESHIYYSDCKYLEEYNWLLQEGS